MWIFCAWGEIFWRWGYKFGNHLFLTFIYFSEIQLCGKRVTLLQGRKCERCSSGEVEDEYHFLFHCNKLENDRNLLLKEIAKSCPNFKRLNSKDTLVWLMNTEEKISLHYYSNIYSKEHEIAWLYFLLWTREGLHITVPWASSLGILSWNETSSYY